MHHGSIVLPVLVVDFVLAVHSKQSSGCFASFRLLRDYLCRDRLHFDFEEPFLENRHLTVAVVVDTVVVEVDSVHHGKCFVQSCNYLGIDCLVQSDQLVSIPGNFVILDFDDKLTMDVSHYASHKGFLDYWV